jgi:hypothetical protein
MRIEKDIDLPVAFESSIHFCIHGPRHYGVIDHKFEFSQVHWYIPGLSDNLESFYYGDIRGSDLDHAVCDLDHAVCDLDHAKKSTERNRNWELLRNQWSVVGQEVHRSDIASSSSFLTIHFR